MYFITNIANQFNFKTMKKLSLLMLVLGSSLYAFAQPTLNLSGMPAIGSTIRTNAVDGTGISPGAAGANQTWDFTAYPDTGAIDSIDFVLPSTTPFYTNFPNSTIAYKVYTDSLNAYGYLKESASALELLGTALNDNTSDIISTYTNPQSIYTFPSTFNSTSTDTYRSYVDYSAFGATFVSNATTNYLVDGYGTLITTSGTFPNTLRIKKREIRTDSTLTDFGDFVSESRNTTYEYVCVAPQASIGVWSISRDTTAGTFGQPDSYSLNVSHTRGEFVITGMHQPEIATLLAFPNPANEQLLILLPQNALVTLHDLSGRVVLSQEFSVENGNMPILETASLPSGTYLMKALGKNYTASGKVIVVH